jgi:hypothetical protein
VQAIAPLALPHRCIVRPESALRGRTRRRLSPRSLRKRPSISAAWNNSAAMNNIFWALLVDLSAVAALVRMDWVYYLVYVVGGVWVFSHWWVRRSLARLRMTRRITHYAFTNEHTAVRIELDNRSWLPLPWLQIQEAVPLELKDQDDYRTIVSLGGRSRLVHDYTLLLPAAWLLHRRPAQPAHQRSLWLCRGALGGGRQRRIDRLPADRAVRPVGLAQPDALWRARCAPPVDRRPGAAERRARLMPQATACAAFIGRRPRTKTAAGQKISAVAGRAGVDCARSRP